MEGAFIWNDEQTMEELLLEYVLLIGFLVIDLISTFNTFNSTSSKCILLPHL